MDLHLRMDEVTETLQAGLKGRMRGPRKLINIQRSPPPRSGAVHPNKEEVRQKYQETFMDERGAPEQTQIQKSLKRVEARTGSLGGIQRNCLSRQGSG